VPGILHLVTRPPRPLAREVIAEQARDPRGGVSVVLWPGVEWPGGAAGAPARVRVFRLVEEGPVRGPDAGQAVDYRRLLHLVFEADTVVTW
jgi:hypothetical protein